MYKSKIILIFGTRPEIIKLSPIINSCIKNNIRYTMIHTGQHYSYELNEQIFKDLNLPEPKYNLHVGSCPHGEQTGKMLIGIEPILQKEKPDAVIVLGDPNSALAGALASSKLQIPVCHIEAGRRSFDRKMSEEINRIIIDHISDLLFTPNELTKQNLLNEGIPEDKIIVCGDTNVDAVSANKEIALHKSSVLIELNLTEGKYFLATIHRPENTDNIDNLKKILSAFKKLSTEYNCQLIFSVHPKTRKMIDLYNLSTDGITITKPFGYLDFLRLEMSCAVLLTDSGSLQEEACILKVPCVTIRNDTERPETVSIGANILVNADEAEIINGVKTMIDAERNWNNPFGEVGVGEHIINEIQYRLRKSA